MAPPLRIERAGGMDHAAVSVPVRRFGLVRDSAGKSAMETIERDFVEC